MHLYIDYELSITAYRKTLIGINALITERERLFTKTQPHSVRYTEAHVEGGPHDDVFASYLVKTEALEKRISEAEGIASHRKTLVDQAEQLLKASKDTYDIIYYQKYVLNWTVRKISMHTLYSEPSIYRMLKAIEAEVKALDGIDLTKIVCFS